MSEDFATRMLHVEEALREYAEALLAYQQWMDAWRARQQPRAGFGDIVDAVPDAPVRLQDWRKL